MRALVITMISPAFGAPTMTLTSGQDDAPSGTIAAHLRAIALTPVAATAHAEERLAQATARKSMVVQVPAPNDNFLALARELRDGQPSLRARATRKAGSGNSRPSAFCRWPPMP